MDIMNIWVQLAGRPMFFAAFSFYPLLAVLCCFITGSIFVRMRRDFVEVLFVSAVTGVIAPVLLAVAALILPVLAGIATCGVMIFMSLWVKDVRK